MQKQFFIQFPSKGMCAIWNHEFTGQFSDGYWENAPANRGIRQYNARDWWHTKATTSSAIDLPSLPCPFSLPAFIKEVTLWINAGDIWPYRMIGLYYNAEKFNSRFDRYQVEKFAIAAAINTGVKHSRSYEDKPEIAMKNISAQELDFLEFLESLDFEQEWKKIIKITNQMQKIVRSYYK